MFPKRCEIEIPPQTDYLLSQRCSQSLGQKQLHTLPLISSDVQNCLLASDVDVELKKTCSNSLNTNITAR